MDKSDCVEETFKQYEDQLLLLFKNCDTNKTGHLTAAEFNELLNVLQLDRSYKEQLLTVLSSNKTVTFGQFKNSLLDIICSSSNEVKREISPGMYFWACYSPEFLFKSLSEALPHFRL